MEINGKLELANLTADPSGTEGMLYYNSTDKEISIGTNLNINCVTGRRNELFEYGIVEENGKRECSITKRTVYQWIIVQEIPTRKHLEDRKKIKKIDCPMCNGKGYIQKGQQTLG